MGTILRGSRRLPDTLQTIAPGESVRVRFPAWILGVDGRLRRSMATRSSSSRSASATASALSGRLHSAVSGGNPRKGLRPIFRKTPYGYHFCQRPFINRRPRRWLS